jgi:hypothetical protein
VQVWIAIYKETKARGEVISTVQVVYNSLEIPVGGEGRKDEATWRWGVPDRSDMTSRVVWPARKPLLGTPMMAVTMADEWGVRRWYGTIPGSLLLSMSTTELQGVLGVFGGCRSVAISLEMEEGT